GEPLGVVAGGDEQAAGDVGAHAEGGDQGGGDAGHERVEVGVEVADVVAELLVAAGQRAQRDLGRVDRVGQVTTSPQTGTHADQLGQRQPGQAAAQRLGSGHAQGVEPVGGAGAVADRAAPRDAQHADRLGRSGGRLGGGGLARLQAAGGLLSVDAVALPATATIGTVATVDV